MFKFNQYSTISTGEIDLKQELTVPENPFQNRLPSYYFQITLSGQNTKIGYINLRMGYTEEVVNYLGNIGYGIREEFRGHNYAAKACLSLKHIWKEHEMDVVWITCNPDNWPSRKTCERIGSELIEIVDVPRLSSMYHQGDKQKCRYRWIL